MVLPPDVLATHADLIRVGLDGGDRDAGVPWLALTTMHSLPPDVLATHADAIFAMLNDHDAMMREAALGAMGRLPPDLLAGHAYTLRAGLDDVDAGVRRAALEAMRSLRPEVLTAHTQTLLAVLHDDSDAAVRRCARTLLKAKLPNLIGALQEEEAESDGEEEGESDGEEDGESDGEEDGEETDGGEEEMDPMDEASSSQGPRSPADAATYRNGVDVRASQIAEAGRGAFTTVEFAQGDYVTEYAHAGGVLSKADVARLTVQTHVLTLANQHAYLDGIRSPVEGQGVGPFANDCFNVRGQPLPDGSGAFEYNVELVKSPSDAFLNRAFLRALRPLRAGEELFWNYEDRAFPMGEKRLSMHKLPNGDTVFEQEVPAFPSPRTHDPSPPHRRARAPIGRWRSRSSRRRSERWPSLRKRCARCRRWRRRWHELV